MVSAVKRKSIEARAVGNEDDTSSDTGKASKKPRSSATSSSSTSSAGASSAAPTATKEDQKTKLLSQLRVGSRIEVWWTGDKKYYPGTVASKVPGGGEHEYFVNYDDGDHHDLDLKEERFRMIKGGRSSKLPSSLTDSNLVVPDEVDTTKLPDGWQDILRAELKACGLGADEDYQRQLEAYDSSDDDAGEPPTPPPTRKRMGYARAAVHYKISHSAANILVKIVDVNLERAGIDTSRSNFTEDDDRLVEELIAKELEESGNRMVRRGFWEKIHQEYFAGRGFTVKMVIDRRKNQLVKKNQMSNGTRATGKESGSSAGSIGPTANTNNDDDRNSLSGKKFTHTDLKLMARLVEKELKETNGDRVRYGFWGKVVEDHFAGRGFTAEQLRNYYKKKKEPRMNEMEEKTKDVSGDHFTDAEDSIIRAAVARQKQESGSDKLPLGFWPRVIKAHSMRRDAKQLSKRWYHLKQTSGATLKAARTTTVTVTGEDQEMSSGSGEEEQPALPGGFTDEEYQSMERSVREELKVTGNERVRPGFWDGILQKSFSDRNLTSTALRKYYSKIKSLKMGEKSTAESTYKKKTSSSESFAAEKDSAVGHSEIMLKDADFKFMQELVRKELEETNCDRVRHGFWGEVVEDHFAGHNLTADQLSGRYRKYKQRILAAASNEITNKEVTSTHEAKSSHGEKFTAKEDAIIIKEVAKELLDHGKLRSGFWQKVVEEHSLNRTTTQLSNRCSYLKVDKGVNFSASLSSHNKAVTSSQQRNNRNAESGIEAPDGPSKFSDQDDRLMERLFKEELKETGTGKARLGFWGKVVDEHFSGRDFDAKALSSRFCYLKSKGKIDLSASTSSEIESAASEPELNLTSDAEDETIGDEVAIDSDTVPLTDDLIMLPAYQATAAQYPPQSRVIYRPSSGESSIFGSVVEVGIYPDQDNLYVYTIGDDAGDQHERIPERFIEKMT